MDYSLLLAEDRESVGGGGGRKLRWGGVEAASASQDEIEDGTGSRGEGGGGDLTIPLAWEE